MFIKERLQKGAEVRPTVVVAVVSVLVASGCGGSKAGKATGGAGAGGSSASTVNLSGNLLDLEEGGALPGTPPKPHGPFYDFSPAPVLDNSVGVLPPPSNAAELFGASDGAAAGAGGGPCLVEPEPGTLFPNNWVRPRFRWIAVGAQNLFELRIKAPQEVHDLVVYTTASQWTMPADMWAKLTTDLQDVPMTVSIRGAVLAQNALLGPPTLGTTGDVTIAPAAAKGSIVYWRMVPDGNTGQLKGYTPGDEGVVLALTADQVQVKPGGNAITCIGCHTSTPDGKFAAFKTLASSVNGGALASVQNTNTGAPPSFWSAASVGAMNTDDFGVPSFSRSHWAAGDFTMLTSLGNGASAQLAWFDLAAQTNASGTAFGYLTRNGDPSGGVMPNFSHDGLTVVYTSTNDTVDGRPHEADSNVFSVPYNNRQGGTATPVAGASDPSYNEYYPAISPDDAWIAFNRLPTGQSTYAAPQAEVFVLPVGGGTPVRLAANDPVACSARTSPGITNSWPKWAPEAPVAGDRTFYWLAFSSKRMDGTTPQLYLTAVVVQGGTVHTYPALYLWAQPPTESNHTPAWDVFEIPTFSVHIK